MLFSRICYSAFIGITSWLLSIFLYSPRLTLFLGINSGQTRRDDLLIQCLDPMARNLNEPILAYRIVQPIIANTLGLCGSRRDLTALLGSPGIAYIALILTLSCCYFAFSKRLGNRLGVILTFSISTTIVTQWTNTHWGHPDSLTLLAIALILCCKNNLLTCLATTLGSLNDERMLLSIPFLLIWWWPYKDRLNETIVKLKPLIFSIILGILFTFLIRKMLLIGVLGPGVTDPYLDGRVDFLSFLHSSSFLSLIFTSFLGFRWLWIIPLIAIVHLLKDDLNIRSLFLILSILLTSLSTFSVADTTRSYAFIFPIIPISVEILLKQAGFMEKRICNILYLLTGLNIFTPAAKVFDVPENWYSVNPLEWTSPALPLPLNLWKWLTTAK